MAVFCLRNRMLGCCLPALLSLSLAGCAPQGLYYWGDYESSLYERYVENDKQNTEAYLRSTFTEAETAHRKVPPGVCADYGFLLYRRGDKAGAIAYFDKEKALYPESQALMDKLIERLRRKEQSAEPANDVSTPVLEGGVQ